jgi:pimeloyl-ACP methyl ester carboxylesterase
MRERLEFDVSGLRLAGRLARARNPRDRAPVIVAIHGAAASSAYFDAGPKRSLLEIGSELGFTVAAFDKPGVGDSDALADPADFSAVADHLAVGVGRLLKAESCPGAPVALIAHSSGAAITTRLAASSDLPFTLVSISLVALGVHASDLVWEFESRLPEQGWVEPPREDARDLQFGPDGTFEPSAVTGLVERMASFPAAEIRYVNRFPELVAEVGEQVTVPVQCLMPEHDRVWKYSESNLRDLVAAFPAARRTEGAVVATAGHAPDHHYIGSAMQLRQLAFALESALTHEEGP